MRFSKTNKAARSSVICPVSCPPLESWRRV